jgi:excisionase family DNA binding protein
MQNDVETKPDRVMRLPEVAKAQGGLLRLKVAAARLGVSVRTVYRIIAEGGLKLVHIRGCACISENELVNYIERNTQRKTA